MKKQLAFFTFILSVLALAMLIQMGNIIYYSSLEAYGQTPTISVWTYIDRSALCIVGATMIGSAYILFFDKIKELYRKAHS